MSTLKDWDTPFGPSQQTEVVNDIISYDKVPSPKLMEQIGWDSFRREAAKDILAGLCAHDGPIDIKDHVRIAIKLADELIKQLKEEKK